jgi:ribose transport system substrate-binding protein
MRRSDFFALLAASFCLALLGCGATTPTPATPAKYTIAVIPKGRTHEFWQSIERGARRAAADLSAQGITVEILWEGPLKENDTTDQIALVQQFAGRGLSGLVLAPQDSKACVPVVKETVDRGTPCVIIDSGLDAPELYVKYVATDNFNGGKMAAQHLLKVLADAGKTAPKIVLFRYQAGSESTEQREAGFLTVLKAEMAKQKAAGKPMLEIISDNVYSGATVETAQAAAGPLLVQVKDKADAIFAVNESATTGLLNVMRSQGLLKDRKIKVMGFDTSEAVLQALQDGELDGTIAQDPYRMGYLGVYTLVRHLEGDDVSSPSKNLSTGERLITRDNVNAASTRELVDPKLQTKRSIETPKWSAKE